MPYPIKELENLLWDFDGVILNSMEVRDIGFRKIFEDYSNEMVEELLDYHRYNGGLSRYVKIAHFFENISKEDFDDEKVNLFASKFSEIMRIELPQKKYIIHDALDFIKKYSKKMNFHIVSGSDQNELRFLCKSLEIEQYFLSIHGSPTPKKQLVKDIMDNKGYDPAVTGLIGDSINDLEAAQVNGLLFYGYNNLDLKDKSNYINQLS